MLNFPSSPTNGQVFGNYTYDGEKWAQTNSGSVNPSNANPAMDGAVAPGVSALYSRGDHIHPTDTSRASLASPVFTGNPTAPTPTTGDSDTSIATTAFVAGAIMTTVVPATALPVMDGVAAVGGSPKYALEDHRHPTDTSLATNASLAAKVAKAGDTMVGNLIISKVDPQIFLNKTTANAANIFGQQAGLGRWVVQVGDSAVETGADAGSNFSIGRYNDAGTYVDAPLSIARSTGRTTFNESVTIKSPNFTSPPGMSSFIPPSGVSGGFFCKDGATQTLGADWFNLLFNGGDGHTYLYIDNTSMGWINTTSDYRIKKDVTPLPSTWAVVKALKPISYTHTDFTPPSEDERLRGSAQTFISGDDIVRWGFIAHELQETLVPSVATGVKDSPDIIQSPDSLPIIAALTRALQEAMARIEALEASR